ncbi:MAG: NAD(P)/FAD-dependent oxidoreductase [Candidatus Korobacteraceae bacterium]
MNNLRHAEVLVAGGGPAGLAAAIAARQAGFEVAVVDCAQPPIDKACGEGIMPDGLDALAELGIRIDARQAAPFRGIRFLHGQQSVEAGFPGGVGYGIPRTVLHGWLVERAAECGVSLHWGRRITGLAAEGLLVEGGVVSSSWLIAADGQNSRLRKLAGLEPATPPRYRFGFRRHYRAVPWSDYVEVHWSDCGQMYVTPVAEDQVCVALITRRKELRFDEALRSFPELAARLNNSEVVGSTMGAISASRTLRVVHNGSIALIGEAAGSVDAITGEGLAISFRQAMALAAALRTGDLTGYETAHSKITRMPRKMARLMLLMDNRRWLRQRAFDALAAEPDFFRGMVAMHTGSLSPEKFGIGPGLGFGWRLLTA